MASIVQRKNRHCVVYTFTDEKGKRRQKWETYKTAADVKRRKKEIEYKEQMGSFVVPQCRTLDNLLREFVALYGKTTWAMSTYTANVALIEHYISPLIGSPLLLRAGTQMGTD